MTNTNDTASVGSDDKSTSAHRKSRRRRQSQQQHGLLLGFGSNYFCGLAGDSTTQYELEVNDNSSTTTSTSTIHARALPQDKLPWKRDELLDIQCSVSSTLFLTKQGRLYQVGSLHGRLYPNPTQMTIPLPRAVLQIACGRHYCLARTESACVVSWGAGHFGQLGLGPHVSVVSTPQLVQTLLPQALGGDAVIDISAGNWHAAVITASGRAFLWGSNRRHQCGRKSPSTIVQPQPLELAHVKFQKLQLGKSHTVGLSQAGKVYTWGSNVACGHLGSGGNTASGRSLRGNSMPRLLETLCRVVIVDIAAGEAHSLALTGGGRVFGWGNNTEGQVGTGAGTLIQGKPKLVADLDFVRIVAKQVKKQPTSSASSIGGGFTRQSSLGSDNQDSICATSSLADTASYDASLHRTSQILPKIPRITSIYAFGCYSVAKSSVGHAYVWGNNDTGMLGIPIPPDLPLMDNTTVSSHLADLSTLLQQAEINGRPGTRTAAVQTFDSNMNLLLPQRLDCISHVDVSLIAGGPSHFWIYGKERETPVMVGRTLLEIEELKQQQQQQAVDGSSLVAVEKDNDDDETDNKSVMSIETDVMTTISTVSMGTAGISVASTTTDEQVVQRDPRPLATSKPPLDPDKTPIRSHRKPNLEDEDTEMKGDKQAQSVNVEKQPAEAVDGTVPSDLQTNSNQPTKVEKNEPPTTVSSQPKTAVDETLPSASTTSDKEVKKQEKTKRRSIFRRRKDRSSKNKTLKEAEPSKPSTAVVETTAIPADKITETPAKTPPTSTAAPTTTPPTPKKQRSFLRRMFSSSKSELSASESKSSSRRSKKLGHI